MLWNAFAGLALAFLAASVLAQQAPGLHQPPPPAPAPPGHWEKDVGGGGESPAAQISRLEALVKAQEKKISLLEAKIKLLEAELQSQRGTSR